MPYTTKPESVAAAVKQAADAANRLMETRKEGVADQSVDQWFTEAVAVAEEAVGKEWRKLAAENRKRLVDAIVMLGPAAFFAADRSGSPSKDLRAYVDSLFQAGDIEQALQTKFGTQDPFRIMGATEDAPPDNAEPATAVFEA